MPSALEQARTLLQRHFGYPDFRSAQQPVLRGVLAGRDTLAVLPTGGGKSICFQIPALMLGGVTVVVSPLIALMQDQVAAASARGIPSAALHSALSGAERERIWRELSETRLRLLYVSPERLARLAPELRARGVRPRLLAVDEAHCISEWGYDFRPSYRWLGAARYRLGRPPVVALTGSATPEVRRDIALSLGFAAGRWDEHVGSFDRPNLWFGVVRVGGERERLEALLRLLAGDDRMVIVYAPTRSVTEALAQVLRQAGHRAAPYHAGLGREARARTLEAFLDDRLDVVVATCAFGMGIDKPQIRLVVHWTLPATPESYYQEAGRAGRDGGFARCVLLWREGDATLHRRQLDVTFPPRRVVEGIWEDPAAGARLPAGVRATAERLRRELRPERGPVDWSALRERRQRAEARIAAVERYARRSACRRAALLGYFGERITRCAGCDRCGAARVTPPPDPRVAARLAALRTAVGGRRGAWGGALLEPATLVALARHPPASESALADVPGVGPAIAARLGATILRALGGAAAPERRLPSPLSIGLGRSAALPADADPKTGGSEGARESRLIAWRRSVAQALGVPAYAVITDATLLALASEPPADLRALARVPGIGPRLLAGQGTALLAVLTDLPRVPAS